MKTKVVISVLLVITVCALALLVFMRIGDAGGEASASPAPDPEDVPVTEAVSPDTADPDQTPEPVPVESRVQELLSGMSEREKICQMFIVYPQAAGTVTGADETLMAGLETYPVGGFVFSAQNLEAGGDATIATIEKMQEWSKLGLIITADEEGGRVTRLMSTLGTTWIDSMYSYKDMGTEKAYENAATIAVDLKTYGFNTALAPVADVFSNPENTVIGDRAYSDDFQQAASLVASAVRGFKDNGVACALKHFPGHGDTAQDSHDGAAIVTKSVSELEKQEFMPFIWGIDAGADMVMIGHLTIPEVDDEPATVSYAIVTGMLREGLNYDGVVISDSLEMGAIAGYESGQLAVRAISAGIDILLGPDDLEKAVSGIELALNNGELTWERIDESVARILKMKLENGIIE